jgi:hypothetical protein
MPGQSSRLFGTILIGSLKKLRFVKWLTDQLDLRG